MAGLVLWGEQTPHRNAMARQAGYREYEQNLTDQGKYRSVAEGCQRHWEQEY